MDLPSSETPPPEPDRPQTGTLDRAPQAQQASGPPAAEEDASCSLAEEELIKQWPTLDRPHNSGLLSHARRGPLLLLTLALLGGGSWYAMRIGPHKSQALASSGSVVAAATTLPADGPTASDTVQDESGAADGQAVGQEALPGVAPVRAEEQAAAAAGAEARPANAADGESGSQPQTASGETPPLAPKGVEAQPTAAGALPPATAGLGERCRKVDAGGRGKPTLVLAACRPAIEAEPEAADIMVMLARAEIDLGRAAEAQAWAKKALRIKRDLPDAYVFLGGAEQEMGKPAEAKAAYRKYLELAPTGRHARELRAVLNSL